MASNGSETLNGSGDAAAHTQWMTTVSSNTCGIAAGVIPTDWKTEIVFPDYKGTMSQCKRLQELLRKSLLSVPERYFAATLLNRVRDQVLNRRKKEQSGFIPSHELHEYIPMQGKQ